MANIKQNFILLLFLNYKPEIYCCFCSNRCDASMLCCKNATLGIQLHFLTTKKLKQICHFFHG